MKSGKSIFYPDSVGYIGWKYYNIIKGKATKELDKEFMFSEFLFSFLVAFIICTTCSSCLGIAYQYLSKSSTTDILKFFESYKTNIEEPLKAQSYSLISNAVAETLDYQGEPQKFTHFLEITSGNEMNYEVRIKNTGKKTWKKDETFLETGPFLKSFSKVRHYSWKDYYRLAVLDKDVKPQETAVFKFIIFGPMTISGEIQENFQVVIDYRAVFGTLNRFFITVKSATPQAAVLQTQSQAAASQSTVLYNTQANSNKASFCSALSDSMKSQYSECRTDANENDTTSGLILTKKILNETPIIRVGLYNTKNTQEMSCNKICDVIAGKKVIASSISSGTKFKVSYDAKTKAYSLVYGALTLKSPDYLRIVPREQDNVVTLHSFDSRPKWNTTLNFNQFRNIIEYRYAPKTAKIWLINELPISQYLKGMAETSNASHAEFQKTIMTAARTYALYHYLRGLDNGMDYASTKHATEFYHVDSENDQVYRGYGSEMKMPNLAKAIDETEGVVVTYNEKLVITPYFSRSDGRTRSWQEVWYGEKKPWCVSVEVPQDKGQSLWGHGVGMSARGALVMARDEGKKWSSILTYFYQGTKLTKIY